ncbi:hypothetical protein JQN72_05880 [Phycicoccus sp. CSK15P-2]|uniref:uridine kinase family protein n=1 Tax=Phycicoccus sp. CSK15P-2 TaxID=2807627 RepID=UPI00195104BE|nr:hypothetical protein [Phycicoccus sp. CSK15P-2]MBM6403770.1 hypothetical protein [Phycicoccus sp. CSK15P-2]
MWFQVTDPADPAHVDAVLAVLATAPPRCGGTRVVAVDGPSGSGKTTLAKGLVDALGCPSVHMDEIFPGWDGLAASVPLLVEQVLTPLSRGEEATYRLWDWEAGRWGGSRTVAAAPVLVLEGCGSSVGPAGDHAAVRVWVEAGRAERMRRGIERDGEAFRPHWERWAAQEAALFAADGTRSRADLVLSTDAGS